MKKIHSQFGHELMNYFFNLKSVSKIWKILLFPIGYILFVFPDWGLKCHEL